MADTVKNGWVVRVLGVALAEGGVDLKQAAEAWRAASEAVDGQIAALQAALRQDGDEDLAEIAEFGLNAITANHKVRLMAAMREVDGGAPGDNLIKLIDAFAAHIATDERVEACDENPLGVAMSIRATLGPALAAMRAALA